MLAQVTHILPLAIVQRERMLPVSGTVVVGPGTRVSPMDVIAEASLYQEHILVDVARGLGVTPAKADTLIEREVGENVIQGDVLAGPVGIGRRVVRSPESGKIVLIGDGQVLIEVDGPPYELKAGMAGEVVKIIPDRGAVIENVGALIQGAWGNGKYDFGLLQSKVSNPEDKLTAAQVDVSLRGTIILGGYVDDPEVLQKAADIPVRGLILGSMSARLVPLAKKLRFPVIVLEGFGHLPITTLSFTLLTSNDGREISVNAEPFDWYSMTRPEVLIPLPPTGRESIPQLTAEYKSGQRVRITRGPYARRMGEVRTIYAEPMSFPSGIRVPAAAVVLSDNQVVPVPLDNLEVIA